MSTEALPVSALHEVLPDYQPAGYQGLSGSCGALFFASDQFPAHMDTRCPQACVACRAPTLHTMPGVQEELSTASVRGRNRLPSCPSGRPRLPPQSWWKHACLLLPYRLATGTASGLRTCGHASESALKTRQCFLARRYVQCKSHSL